MRIWEVYNGKTLPLLTSATAQSPEVLFQNPPLHASSAEVPLPEFTYHEKILTKKKQSGHSLDLEAIDHKSVN